MKKLSITIIASIAILISAFTISNLWNVNNENVVISFELPNNGTKGTLGGLKASIDFNAKNPTNSKITASVDIKTLNTGDSKKDAHLMAADFFDAEKHPTISFQSSSIKATDNGFVAVGSLTIKDSTKTIEVPFSFIENKDGTALIKGTMSLLSSDYGVMKKSATEKDKVVVTLTVPLKK